MPLPEVVPRHAVGTLAGTFGETEVRKDEANRPDATGDGLAKRAPAFREDGARTAGHAPGLTTVATGMAVGMREIAEDHRLRLAARLALARAGWSMVDMGRAEIDEPSTASALGLTDDFELSGKTVNAEDGAILTTRLMHAMSRESVGRGLVTLCIGGGQGIALLLESDA